MKPFLLNFDGSFPNRMNEEKLLEYGLTPVLPSPYPEIKDGFQIVELSPIYIKGDWVQTWGYEPLLIEPQPVGIENQELIQVINSLTQDQIETLIKALQQ